MKKREEFYHKPIMNGYGNFRVEWREYRDFDIVIVEKY